MAHPDSEAGRRRRLLEEWEAREASDFRRGIVQRVVGGAVGLSGIGEAVGGALSEAARAASDKK